MRSLHGDGIDSWETMLIFGHTNPPAFAMLVLVLRRNVKFATFGAEP
jgi:hypothetical protein